VRPRLFLGLEVEFLIQNNRFPALSRKVLRLRVMAYIAIILAVVFAIVILLESLDADSRQIKIGGSLFAGLIFVLGLVIGEGFFLAAESIEIFLAIEMNTRPKEVDIAIERELQKELEEREQVIQVKEAEYTLKEWASRKNNIMEALNSNDLVEKEWALNELKNFSNEVKEAKEILEKHKHQ
jgi:hypothetical protein